MYKGKDVKSIIYFNQNIAKEFDFDNELKVCLNKDCNIKDLDYLVRLKLNNERNNIEVFENELSKLIKQLDNSILLRPSEEFKIKNKIKNIKDKINNLTENNDIKKYDLLSKELLIRYEELNKDENDIKYVISSYLTIASKFIKLTVVRDKEFDNICNLCSSELNYVFTTDDLAICLVCKNQIQNKNIIKIFNRISSEENNNNVNDININNFIKILNEFDLTSNFTMNQHLIDTLDNYFLNINMDLKRLKGGKSSYNSIDVIKKALRMTKMSSYLKNIYHILNKYCGWPENNISDVKRDIIELHIKVTTWFKKNPMNGRIANPNNQWLLFMYCSYLIPGRFKETDFMIIEGKKSISVCKMRWNEMLSKSNIFKK